MSLLCHKQGANIRQLKEVSFKYDKGVNDTKSLMNIQHINIM